MAAEDEVKLEMLKDEDEADGRCQYFNTFSATFYFTSEICILKLTL
jgi:hypothetical protein